METTSYRIPAANINALRADLAKLQARAEKIAKKGDLADVTPIGLEIVERVVEGEKVFFICRVTGSTPKLAGWTFIATLQHEEAGTILRSVPTASFPEGTLTRFREATPACDHCRYNRRRNDTFVVRHDDGAVKQVGRNCLAAFTGVTNPDALAAMAEFVALAGQIADAAQSEGGPRAEVVSSTETFLGYVVCSIRESGWLSRTKARDLGGRATADHAWTAMHPTPMTRREDRLFPTDADRALALTALGWVNEHFDNATSESLGDYEHNLRVALAGGMVTHRLAGIVGSAIGYYERAIGRILTNKVAAERRAAANEVGWVGTPKKRETFSVTLVAVFDYESTYGVVHAHKFLTSTGAVIMWKTGSDKLDLGEYTLTGSVKEHSEYRGEKQTVVTRCKAEKVAVAA